MLDKLDGAAKLDGGATKLPSLADSIASSAKKSNNFNARNRSINMSRQEQDITSQHVMQDELN